jgi:hypothetical protein
MICTSSDTLVFDHSEAGSTLDASCLAEFTAAYTMMRQHGSTLQVALGESKISAAVLVGSSFCAAAALDNQGMVKRGLLGPEEMSANMVLQLLADG